MNTTAVTTCDNPSVSPYASTTFSEQPEPSSHVVTTATTRRDANGREDPPSLTELIHWIARPRPVWMRDAACREHPEVNFFPARGEDRRPALAVCGRCLVLNECRQWALHDPHAPSHGIVGGLSEQARRNARRARRARTIPTTETEHS